MPKLAPSRLAACALAACALIAAPDARASQPGTPEPERDPEIALQKQAVADLRNVGTAMFSWLTDRVTEDDPVAEAGKDQPDACNCGEDGDLDDDTVRDPNFYDVRNVPAISYEALRAILVPQYIIEIPKTDPWGNPYDYRLKVRNLLSRNVLAIRSGGSDGRFDADDYRVVGFLPTDVVEDLVWADGFLVRWPEVPKAEKAPVQK